MGVVTSYQGALHTWDFTLLNSYSYFTDLRKCMKWPLHLIYATGSCIFGTLAIITVYGLIIKIAQYRIVK